MAEMGFERDFDGATDRAIDAGTDAGTLAESNAPPRLILPDGSGLGVDGLLALPEGGPEEPPPIETAAGAETSAGEAGETVSSGGGSAYGDDLGGDDGMRGKDGDDSLDGGSGADILSGGDGPDLGDLSAAVSSVQDDGSDVTLAFEDGGSLWLGGLGTGAIDSVNPHLSEIGQSSVEVVGYQRSLQRSGLEPAASGRAKIAV